MQREIAVWLEDVKFETRSRNTFRVLRSQIEDFRRWCAPRGIVQVGDIDRDVVRRYLQEARDAGYALTSLRTRAYALRTWFAWLEDEGLLDRAPRFQTPRPVRTLVRPPTVEQIDAVVDQCDDGTPLGARDRALILFLYGSGVRVSEASKLDLADLDLAERAARVIGKGGRERVARFPERAAEALRVYVERYRAPCDIPKHADAVFTSRIGTRLSSDMIRLAVRTRGKAAGVEGLHPHLFRHAAATHLLDAGADIRHVQEVMGHAEITSTQRYTHVTAETVRRTVERFHPHARPGHVQGGPGPQGAPP